jgi:hypothetical protein
LAATIKRLPALRLPTKQTWQPSSLVVSGLLALIACWLARFGLGSASLVVLALLVVVIVELGPVLRRDRSLWLSVVPRLALGASAVIIVAVSLRAATQIAVGLIYAIARWWLITREAAEPSFVDLFGLQVVVLEAIFLAAAIWRTPSWICLGILWIVSYALVFEYMQRRKERLGRIMAATWSLIVVEVSWVLLNWLVSYVLVGGFIVVPQAALVLSGLAYCFGGIYWSQRHGALTRARLAEYLFIALLLVVIVASATPWRGSL